MMKKTTSVSKRSKIMSIRWLVILVITHVNGLAQQFEFSELVAMLNNRRVYEESNFRSGNSIVKNRNSEWYSYTTNLGIGGSVEDPRTHKDSNLIYSDLSHIKSYYSNFAEDYNKSNKTAVTWYDYTEEERNFIITPDGKAKNRRIEKTLRIVLFDDRRYQNIMNDIIENCTYVGIEEEWWGHWVKYKSGSIIIKCGRDDEDGGGKFVFQKGNIWE